MDKDALHIEFLKAFKKASQTKIKLPPDVMLHFYAYYKQAALSEKEEYYVPSGESELRNAFKLNALLQVKNLTADEAKRKYIQLVERYITE